MTVYKTCALLTLLCTVFQLLVVLENASLVVWQASGCNNCCAVHVRLFVVGEVVSLCGKYVYTSLTFFCALWLCTVVHTYIPVLCVGSVRTHVRYAYIEMNFNHVHKHIHRATSSEKYDVSYTIIQPKGSSSMSYLNH